MRLCPDLLIIFGTLDINSSYLLCDSDFSFFHSHFIGDDSLSIERMSCIQMLIAVLVYSVYPKLAARNLELLISFFIRLKS